MQTSLNEIFAYVYLPYMVLQHDLFIRTSVYKQIFPCKKNLHKVSVIPKVTSTMLYHSPSPHGAKQFSGSRTSKTAVSNVIYILSNMCSSK